MVFHRCGEVPGGGSVEEVGDTEGDRFFGFASE